MTSEFNELRKKLIAETKKKIKESVKKDHLVIQAVNSIDEADKAANMLARCIMWKVLNAYLKVCLSSQDPYNTGNTNILVRNLLETDSLLGKSVWAGCPDKWHPV